jgi:nitrate reductase cytochrome c-type subunit
MRRPESLFLILLFGAFIIQKAAGQDTVKLKASYYEVSPYVEDNEKCLTCHGEPKYTLKDSAMGRTVTEYMCPDRIIDRDAFYSGVHRSFSCLDCHPYDFEVFPHSVEARLTEMLLCMDCHGYDESYAQYHFEEIEGEYGESIHHIEGFSCWKCHDPHSYRAFMRNTSDIKDAILYDNNMCLNCHGNFERFMLLTDREEINLVASHDWLPNQLAHIRSVRCIECHTEINDSILIAHKILPKKEAVRNCAECHSRDSRLMQTLYKFEVKEERKAGFVNGVIINNAYVIGANQNVILNRLSLIVFALTFLVILFHTVLRIIKLKNK